MTRIARYICAFVVVLTGMVISVYGQDSQPAKSPPAEMRVLLFSGSNNHDWRQTTPALVRILEDSGVFTVDVIDDPGVCTAPMLRNYDVVLSNWTNYPSTERAWGQEAEQALLDFVRSGRGFVVFHGAAACFPTWPEFQQLIGATWGQDTGHGRYHRFPVSVADANHPITAGLRGFSFTDELWHRMQTQPFAHALVQAYSITESGGSGRSEPVAFAMQFGEGRCFNLVLGHDVAAMDHPAWRLLMLRGTQWAATGDASIQVPFDVASTLESLKGYRREQDRRFLGPVNELVHLSAGYPRLRAHLAQRMIDMLKSEATDDSRAYVLEQVSLIASTGDVRELAAFIGDPQLGHAACITLERIPGEDSLAALRNALDRLEGRALIGVVNSLGQRRDRQAVSRLTRLLERDDPETGAAIVEALGKIGGRQAIDAVRSAATQRGTGQETAWADALLQCAESLADAGDPTGACAIYETLLAPGNPPSARRAAFIGLTAHRSDGNARGKDLATTLSSDDPALQRAAVHTVRQIHNSLALQSVASRLDEFDASIVPPVILALADTGDRAVLAHVIPFVSNTRADIRLAALQAVGRLGGADAVPVLAHQIDKADDAERAAIQRCIGRLPGTEVNQAIVERLTESSGSQVRTVLIAVLVERQAYDTVPILLGLVTDEDQPVRIEAVKAAGALAGGDSIPILMAALSAALGTQERRAIEDALVAIARRPGNCQPTIAGIAQAISDVQSQARESLLRILGRLGGPPALDVVRDNLNNEEPTIRQTAVRVLGAWPDSSPLGDLLTAAREAENVQIKILALRGFANLYRQAQDLTEAELKSMAAEAMALADRRQERSLLLSALAESPLAANLEIPMSLLDDADLKREAALAALSILEALGDRWPDRAKSALAQIRTAASNSDVTARAEALMLRLSRPVNLAVRGVGSSPDGLEKDGAAGGDQAAIDGDPATYWDEADGHSLYRYRVTFADEVRISSLSIMGYQHHNYAPKDFVVLCDGKPVKAVRDAVYTDNLLIVTFPATSCRTVELEITGRYGPSPAIRELEIYAAPD